MGRAANKRVSRPPKVDRRRPMTIRLRDTSRADLQAAADRNSRSLSEEIESLIEQAAEAKRYGGQMLDLAYGRKSAGLVLALAQMLQQPEGVMDDWFPDATRQIGDISRHWLDEPAAFAVAQRVFNTVLNALRPPGTPTSLSQEHERLAWAISGGVLAAIAHQSAGIAERLGPEITERAKQFLGRTDLEENGNG